MSRSNGRRNSSKRLLRKYLLIVISIVGCFLALSSIGVYAFFKIAEPEAKPIDYTKEGSTEGKDSDKDSQDTLESLLLPPKKTNVLLLGTDKSKTLSDVIIVGSFDRDTASINLINIPRDLYCAVLPEIKTQVKEKAGRNVPSEVKMTDLHSWSGGEMGPWAVKTQLESYMGIAIDYTVRIDLEAFRKIVDLLGPIEMEIPEGGFDYKDPEQNLVIDVPGGLQKLDGVMAEGVVRYRDTYRRGDLQRIEVQQEFMKCFFQQALEKDNLISNAPGLFSAIYEYVETDFKLGDMYKYIRYIPKLSSENFKMTTLPGEPKTIYYNNNANKISYYFYDPVETADMVEDIFYNLETPDKPKVQVFNSGMEKSDADVIVSKLNEAGFDVTQSGEYEKDKPKENLIITKDKELAEMLKKYMEDAIIESSGAVDEDYDAAIILAGK